MGQSERKRPKCMAGLCLMRVLFPMIREMHFRPWTEQVGAHRNQDRPILTASNCCVKFFWRAANSRITKDTGNILHYMRRVRITRKWSSPRLLIQLRGAVSAGMYITVAETNHVGNPYVESAWSLSHSRLPCCMWQPDWLWMIYVLVSQWMRCDKLSFLWFALLVS